MAALIPTPKIDHLVRTQRKTIALIVRPDGSLEVRAPKRASMIQIQAFVISKGDWIRKHQERIKKRTEEIPQRMYREGEPFLYLGTSCRLHFSPKTNAVHLIHSELHTAPAQPAGLEKQLTAWYRREARRIFTAQTEHIAQTTGYRFNSIRINSARTRWGSCGPHGSLNFTWRLVMAPLAVINYVVLHELVHTKIRNHGPDFWKHVAEQEPNFQKYINWLNTNGHLLSIDVAADESLLQPLNASGTAFNDNCMDFLRS